MKNPILFLIFSFVFIIHATAQRKIDLKVTVVRVLPGDTIKPYQLFLFDGKTPYYFALNVDVLGPDSMVVGDTIFYKTSWSNTKFYFPILMTMTKFGAQMNVTPGQGYIDDPSGYTIFLPKPGASPGHLDTVIWCDTTWMVSALGNPATDTNLSNNYRCSPPVVIKSVPVSVETIQSTPEFDLYPNPATNRIHCLFTSNKSASSQIILRNLIGNEIYRSIPNKLPGKQQLDIDVSWLPRGLYIVELHLEEQVIIKKIALP